MEVLEVRKTDSETLFKNYINSQSYQKDFKEFMYKMVDKYGIEILNLNGIGEQLDINKAIKKMMSSTTMADTSVDSNSNTNIVTSGAVFTETCKAHSLIHNHYRVWKYMKKNHGVDYANDLMERKISGQIYINDLSGFYPYCFNFDPIHFALYGIPKKLDGKGESLPPQHMESFFGILEDILPIFAKNLAGACGIATLFPVLSIYVQKALLEGNKIDEIQLKDEQAVWDFLKVKLTSLLYNLNRPARDGSQSLFTNVSIMSPTFLQETCKDMTLVFKNGMVITADVDTTLRIQDIWIDVFNKESERRLFTFPVQTLSIATIEDENGKPKIVDTDFYNEMMKKNIKLGAMNVYAGDSSTLSSCCRLRSDKAKVFTNSLGGSSSNIGSFGVCTVNLATLALRYKGDINKFYTELDKNIEYAQEVNRCKMNFIKRDIKNGNLPMYDLRFVELDKQYATLGINGLYECCQELGYDYRLEENRDFVKSLLQHINRLNDKLGEEMNHIVNVEQIPAENVAVKLANIDKKLGLNSKYDIYANQFIPLDVNTEGGILDRISIQGELDEYFSGGSILHINLDQECKDEDLFLELGKYAIENGVRYFGINYATNHCNNCGGTFVGKLEECPHCQSKNFETWCRTVGYMVPVENYNKVRRQEFERRVFYKEHSIKVTE